MDIENNFELPTTKDIEYYQRVREVGIEVNQKLIEELPKSALKECGKKLGIWKGNTLVLGSEDELSIFFDYCLHQFRINKTSVIERHLTMSPPDSGSIELEVLQSLVKSHYSVFLVKEVFENKGALIVDLLYLKELFIIDIGISKTASVGVAFSGHLFPLKQFYMGSGAFLQIPIQSLLENVELTSILEKFHDEDSDAFLSKNREANFAAQIIRTVFRAYAEKSEKEWM
jgi:hypothetical protein